MNSLGIFKYFLKNVKISGKMLKFPIAPTISGIYFRYLSAGGALGGDLNKS